MPLGDLRPDLPGQRHAALQRRPANGDERNHVDGAHSGMLASVPRQIDARQDGSEQRTDPLPNAPSSPTNVRTLRLWDESEETSSNRTPGAARTAAAISDTTVGSRPEEMFGTHSITVRIAGFPRRRSL